jgi:hypothetical protein
MGPPMRQPTIGCVSWGNASWILGYLLGSYVWYGVDRQKFHFMLVYRVYMSSRFWLVSSRRRRTSKSPNNNKAAS